MRLFLLSLVTSCLLLPACGSLPTTDQFEAWKTGVDKTVATAAIIAEKAKAGLDVVAAAQAATEAKIEASFAELEAKGFDTSSTAALWESAKANPVEAGGSGLALLVAFGALLGKYKRAKKAVLASTDAYAGMSPAAQDEFKTAAQASAHMSPDVAGLIAEAAAR